MLRRITPLLAKSTKKATAAAAAAAAATGTAATTAAPPATAAAATATAKPTVASSSPSSVTAAATAPTPASSSSAATPSAPSAAAVTAKRRSALEKSQQILREAEEFLSDDLGLGLAAAAAVPAAPAAAPSPSPPVSAHGSVGRKSGGGGAGRKGKKGAAGAKGKKNAAAAAAATEVADSASSKKGSAAAGGASSSAGPPARPPAPPPSPPPPPPPSAGANAFNAILERYYAQNSPYADTDEVLSEESVAEGMQMRSPETSSSPSETAEAAEAGEEREEEEGEAAPEGGTHATASPAQSAHILTHRNFAASITCPKKFYLYQCRGDLLPRTSIGAATRLEDSAGFNELARRFDRFQFGSKAIVISGMDVEQAAQRTEEAILRYFNTVYATMGVDAPTLTIHRAAFLAPFGGEPGSDTHPLRLCARPAVLRYRPKENQWVILESQAIVDPFQTTARCAACLQRVHFTMMAFRHWVTQPHIPIAVRKRFLDLQLDGATADALGAGQRLEATAGLAAPIDLRRSGVMHIRQFFPGPATLLDCGPQKLVKFVARAPLDELLEADCRNSQRAGNGAFDVSHACGRLHPEVRQRLGQLRGVQARVSKYTNARSASALKRKDTEEHVVFELQQRLLEAILRHHTLPLVQSARAVAGVSPAAELASDDSANAALVRRWTAFAEDDPVHGTVKSALEAIGEADAGGGSEATQAPAPKRRGRGAKTPADGSAPTFTHALLPEYSAFTGSHCSKGEACPFFAEGKCLPCHVENPLRARDDHLFTVPSTSVAKKAVWWADGLRTVRDVLHRHKRGDIKLTAPQLRYVKTVAEGKIALNPGEIDRWFGKITYPVFVVDFEAAQFALPPYARSIAYQSIPFQFSVDVFTHDILTETPKHYNFLHFGKGYSPNEDPRPACAAELMRIVRAERAARKAAMEESGELERIRKQKEEEEAGAAAAAAAEAEGSGGKRRGRKPAKPKKKTVAQIAAEALEGAQNPWDGCFIAHFASFERSCLEKMGQMMEEYQDEMRHFFFLDTMELMKKGFVHPNAHGSNSLKKILPAICPEFQYGTFGFESADGGGEGGAGDEGNDAQRGDNALGIFRLWHHQEGGGSIQDVAGASATPDYLAAAGGETANAAGGGGELARTAVPRQERDRVWAMLRIQLLEYCSLDTKALYEIIREVWAEKSLVPPDTPADKTGWVVTDPTAREITLL